MNLVQERRLSLSAKIYLQVALSGGLVAALAGGAIVLSQKAEAVAYALYEDGFVRLEQAVSLDRLLDQHRRVVESAPAEFDRARLREDEETLAVINAELAAALAENSPATASSNEILRKSIVAALPPFLE